MITAIILTHNSAKDLKDLIPSLKPIGRILVIDDVSTDKTVEVARSLGATVYQRKLKDNFAAQRNFGLRMARTKWVVFIDADERASKMTLEEIKAVTNRKDAPDGFQVRRIDIFNGKELKYGETGQMWLTRLGKKKAGRWKRQVHEVWKINKVSQLNGPIYHKSHQSWQSLINKIRTYARIEAKYRSKTGQSENPVRMMVWPVGKFVYNYMWKKGFLDGRQGLLMALGMSYHSFLVRWYWMQDWWIKITPKDMWGRLLVVMVVMILAMMPLGQFLRFEAWGLPPVYLFEVVMALVILVGGLRLVWVSVKPKVPGYAWSLAAMVMGLGVSLMANLNEPRVSLGEASLYWWRFLLYGVLGVVVSVNWQAMARRLNLAKGLALVGTGLAVGGMGQYLLVPDTRFLFLLGWDDHYYRAVGTIFDPGFLGILLVLGLIASLKQRGMGWWYARLLMLAVILLTYARSTYLVLVVVFGLWFLRQKKVLALVGAGLGLGLGIIFLPKPGGEGVDLSRTYSIVERARSVVTAMEIFAERPVFGIGFNAYRQYTLPLAENMGLPIHPSGPDNSIMLVLATAGIVGGIGFTVHVIDTLIRYRKNEVVWLSLTAIILHSMTNNTFFYALVMLWWNLILAEGDLQQEQKESSKV